MFSFVCTTDLFDNLKNTIKMSIGKGKIETYFHWESPSKAGGIRVIMVTPYTGNHCRMHFLRVPLKINWIS